MSTSDQKLRLKDKVAIVTGGSRGIGRAIVFDFVREGAKVIACGRTQSNLDKLSHETANAGYEVLARKADVSVEREVENMVAATIKKFGKVDILVNNAAIVGPHGVLPEIKKEAWDEVLDINVGGVFLCSRAVLRHMMERKAGNIINVTTSKGWKRMKEAAGAYRTSKCAIEGLTVMLSKQMKPYGICVNAMGPATTNTDMIRGILDGPGRRLRMWQPEEVSKLAVFLALQTVDTLTGESIDFMQWQRKPWQ